MFRVLFFIILCLMSFTTADIQTSEQLVVVVSNDWNDFRGQLYRMEKVDSKWQQVGKPWPVVIGRNGLGWGRGEHTVPKEETKKREGDGKAPAGIFYIRPMLFGYAEKPQNIDWPYTQLTTDWKGVDDSNSKYYNQIVNINNIKEQDWNSHEEMRRKDHLYRWVMVVEHNTKNTVKKAGSCIFIHLWRSPKSPTAGCTAMSEKNLLQLVKWLDVKKQPIIAQFPGSTYQKYRLQHNWPDLVKERK